MLVRYPHLVGTLELLLAVIVTCSKATYLEAFLVKSVLTTRFRRQIWHEFSRYVPSMVSESRIQVELRLGKLYS